MKNEEKTEKYQNIVLAAIKKIENIKDEKSVARFASMNYSIYEVAMEAVKIAEEIEYSQPQIIEIFGKRVKIVKDTKGTDLCEMCAFCSKCDHINVGSLCEDSNLNCVRHFVEVDEDGNEI